MKPKNLDELYEMMKNDDVSLPEWDCLPVFSDKDIEDTLEVWSWDNTRKIVGTCSYDIEIIDRTDM